MSLQDWLDLSDLGYVPGCGLEAGTEDPNMRKADGKGETLGETSTEELRQTYADLQHRHKTSADVGTAKRLKAIGAELKRRGDAEKAKLTPQKARQILHDKEVHGKPLTEQQRRYFGAVASGVARKAWKKSLATWLQKSMAVKGYPGDGSWTDNFGGSKLYLKALEVTRDQLVFDARKQAFYEKYEDIYRMKDRVARAKREMARGEERKGIDRECTALETRRRNLERQLVEEKIEAEKYAEKSLVKADGGPFIGPRGGKWADAKHTIPWKEGGKARTLAKPKPKHPTEMQAMDLWYSGADAGEAYGVAAGERGRHVNDLSKELQATLVEVSGHDDQPAIYRKGDGSFVAVLESNGLWAVDIPKDFSTPVTKWAEVGQSKKSLLKAEPVGMTTKGKEIIGGPGPDWTDEEIMQAMRHHNELAALYENQGEMDRAQRCRAMAGTFETALDRRPVPYGGNVHHIREFATWKSEAAKTLGEYLEKADPAGTGIDAGPANQMPKGQPGMGNAADGDAMSLAGKGTTSGKGDSVGWIPGMPDPPTKKLSEDDAGDEAQMRPHKKPLERTTTSTRKSSGPADNYAGGRQAYAGAVSRLQKGPGDVQVGVGVASPPEPAAPPLEKGETLAQHPEAMIVYSNQEDIAIERFQKGDNFYHGTPPGFRNGALLETSVLCKGCDQLRPRVLDSCPRCGVGTEGPITAVGRNQIPAIVHDHGQRLRPMLIPDVHMPNGVRLTEE